MIIPDQSEENIKNLRRIPVLWVWMILLILNGFIIYEIWQDPEIRTFQAVIYGLSFVLFVITSFLLFRDIKKGKAKKSDSQEKD